MIEESSTAAAGMDKTAASKWRLANALLSLSGLKGSPGRLSALVAAKNKLGLGSDLPGLSAAIAKFPAADAVSRYANRGRLGNYDLLRQPSSLWRGHGSVDAAVTDHAQTHASPLLAYAASYARGNPAAHTPLGKVTLVSRYAAKPTTQYGPDGAFGGNVAGAKAWKPGTTVKSYDVADAVAPGPPSSTYLGIEPHGGATTYRQLPATNKGKGIMSSLVKRMDKIASTAFVRQITKGLLSPKTIQRAAAAMPQGKFRTLGHLGRGQFSVADKVVGNFGNGNAGIAVRKMPTTQVSPQAEYGPLSAVTTHLNEHYKPSLLQRTYARVTGREAAPPLAPYLSINDKGGFQAMADGFVPWKQRGLKKTLGDLHADNIGPKGQIFDFAINSSKKNPNMATMPGDASPPKLLEMFRRPRLDAAPMSPAPTLGRDGHLQYHPPVDLFGNAAHHFDARQMRKVQPLLTESNNNIRKYWSSSPEQQAAMLPQVENRMPDVMQAIKPPKPGLAATTPEPPPRKIGMWTDFRYGPDRKPYYAGAGVLGGASYGAYKGIQALTGNSE